MKATPIVIVTYNALPWIDKCLASCGDHPVIVVDNASTDASVSHIRAAYPRVTVLPQAKNLGFGQGNNVGISYALKQGAEHILLLNQDAYLGDDCLELLLKIQQEYPQYGILSPIHLNGKGDALDNNFGNYISYRKSPELLTDLLFSKKKEVYDLPFVNAACWLLSRGCLQTVGGFDPIFFHYAEDDNYCQRVLYHGFKIGLVPKAFVNHDRENRKTVPIEKYSKGYFQKIERSYKLKYTDITKDDIDINAEINRLKRSRFKQFLKFRFHQAGQTQKQLSILLSLRNDLLKSRQRNRQKGNHYLA